MQCVSRDFRIPVWIKMLLDSLLISFSAFSNNVFHKNARLAASSPYGSALFVGGDKYSVLWGWVQPVLYKPVGVIIAFLPNYGRWLQLIHLSDFIPVSASSNQYIIICCIVTPPLYLYHQCIFGSHKVVLRKW